MSDPTNVFAPPEDGSGPATSPMRVMPILSIVLAGLLSPLLGGFIAGTNWWRVGRRERAIGVTLTPLIIACGARMYLVTTVITIIALTLDQRQFHNEHPELPTYRWATPIMVGLVLVLLSCIAMPTVLWLITGDPTLRPEMMGPPP